MLYVTNRQAISPFPIWRPLSTGYYSHPHVGTICYSHNLPSPWATKIENRTIDHPRHTAVM